MTGGRTALRAVMRRELLAARRTRTYALLLAGVAAVALGTTLVGGGAGAGYVPAVVDLLLPFELLVPAVAFAVGYRAIVDDARRGELAVLRTYPVPSWAYVLGVYLGRAAVVAVLVVVPLALVGVVAAAAAPEVGVFAAHRGVDSPVLFARFVVLTVAFALTALAVAVAVSALSRSRSRAILLALVGVVALVAGTDLVVLGALDVELVGDGGLRTALAASPASAYRGLVFETVVSVAFERREGFAAPVASVAGLLAWTVGSLLVATVAVARRG